ncbi:DUF1294 domain-containing protein [Methylopila sp. 73B]|uniref:DUF1294 domain-containing protein n=1 Tax=Methylopila sp. 73B TaxID=1120792 RepID=UPI00037CB94E|nr:DUF1294 domain-containing protein [Methylopila sp. 73B]
MGPSALPLAALYLLGVNAAAFMAFVSDKARAGRGDWRIPERTLLMLAALGGSVGALAGQRLLRHKTWKEPFRSILDVIAMTHGVLAGALCGWLLWRAIETTF